MKMGGLKQQANKLNKGPGLGRPQIPGGYSVGSNQGLTGGVPERTMIGRANNGMQSRSIT